MQDQIAEASLDDQIRALTMFMKQVGRDILLRGVTPRHAEAFVAPKTQKFRWIIKSVGSGKTEALVDTAEIAQVEDVVKL